MSKEQLPPRYMKPSSTSRLRTHRDNALAFLSTQHDKCVGHDITLHYFVDCILAYYKVSNTGRESDTETIKAYSRDHGVTWFSYKDQFEPKMGYHDKAHYRSFTDTFPEQNH